MDYSSFQNQASSEKLTLAVLHASKRLMGWSLHSGSVYKLTNFDVATIVSIEDSGNAYTEVSSLGAVTASKFYNDRTNKVLYLRTTGSNNPNGRFLSIVYKLFFASSPIALPHDLNSGEEVYWEGMIESTSQFGVEIDTVNQTSEAIEGSGTLSLFNDQSFWKANFDKNYFENQLCYIYSHNRDLSPTEAKLIFRGRVEKKSFNEKKVTFSLKDILSEIRSPISLGTIGDLGLRTSSDLEQARQRLVLGRVFGHVAVNTDQVLDGYPITGTVSVAYNSATLTGVGTDFLTELSPDDELILNDVSYTVASISSATSLTLTENYSDLSGLSGAAALVLPNLPKRWMNRTWTVAGHALRQPTTSVAAGSSITRLIVDDATDIFADDWIYLGTLGSGELLQVDTVTGAKILNLKTSLATIPTIGTAVMKPAVQNVRIDDVQLAYYQDYTFDAETATLTLRKTAEANSAPIRSLTSNLVFTNGSRTVTGTGLKNSIKPGYMVGVVGNAVFFEIMSVDSDTQLTLRSSATFTANAVGRYKSLVFDPENNTLSMDVLGKTDDGTSSGALLKTAPAIVKGLLIDAGLEDNLDLDSFETATAIAPMHVGLVVPANYAETSTAIYRDVINDVNKSVFGSLIQTADFRLAYSILEPNKTSATLRLEESDILSFTYQATSEILVKTTILQYQPKEYDYLTGKSSILTSQKTSDISNYIVKSTREKTIESKLVQPTDASRAAHRWAFISENGAGRMTINTKLQASRAEVGSIIEINHRKFFERLGLNESTGLFLVESVKKSGTNVQLDVVDLSGAFARVANINEISNTFSAATDQEKLYGGFITDAYGLIDNDPNSFGINLIW